MVDRLKGKVAIITGGSAGIGKGIAKLFVSEGAKVVIAARNKKMLEEAIKEINSSNAIAVECDVTEARDVKELIKRTVDRFKKLDIFIIVSGTFFSSV